MINKKQLRFESRRYKKIPTSKIGIYTPTYGSNENKGEQSKIRLTINDGKIKGKSKKAKNILPNIKKDIKRIDVCDIFFVGAVICDVLNVCEELSEGKSYMLGALLLNKLSKALTKELTENECNVIYWLTKNGYNKKNGALISEEKLIEEMIKEGILDKEKILNAINSLKEKQCIDIINGNVIVLEKVVVNK